VNYGIRPIGALIGGVVATHLGVSVTVVAAAIVGTTSVLWMLSSPVIAVRTVGELSAE
jgi:predicted MFS family arabinose efflux permease